jgi:hypothetical protein
MQAPNIILGSSQLCNYTSSRILAPNILYLHYSNIRRTYQESTRSDGRSKHCARHHAQQKSHKLQYSWCRWVCECRLASLTQPMCKSAWLKLSRIYKQIANVHSWKSVDHSGRHTTITHLLLGPSRLHSLSDERRITWHVRSVRETEKNYKTWVCALILF